MLFGDNNSVSWVNMGPEDLSNREKNTHNLFLMPNFRKWQEDSKNVSLKIGSKVPQKLGP